MRKSGRKAASLTEREREMIKEFLNNDMSYEAYAQKIGLTKSQLIYRVNKYRKEQEERMFGKTEVDG